MYLQNKNTRLRWLRAYYIYGDDDRGASIFSKINRAAKEGAKTFPFTSGKNQYDFLHIDDVAKQIAAATLQNRYDGIINVCSGKPVPLATQVEKYIKDNALDITLSYGSYPDRKYDSPAVWGDSATIDDIMNNFDKYCD